MLKNKMKPYKIIEQSGYLEIAIDKDMRQAAVIATYLALSEKAFPNGQRPVAWAM